MESSFLIICKIAISFTVLFVLPFILVTARIFHREDKLFQIYVSMIIGLFASMVLVYLLAVFDAFNKINFLLSYGSIILVANLYFLRQVKHWRISFKLKLTGGFVLLLFALAIGGYMRLYDPLKHISLGSGDFYQHLQFIKNTADGYVFSAYPKGYHIILALIYYVSNIDFYALARFVSAFFGIISIGAVYCLMKHVFGAKAAIFAVLFYSGFTLFNYLTIEEIGLFPQGFGFILVPLIICFALELVNNFRGGSIRKRNILVFAFLMFLLGLTSPYTMLLMTYVLGLMFFFSLLFYRRIRRSFKKVAALLVLFSLGMCIVVVYYVAIDKFHNIRLGVRTYDETKIAELMAEGEGTLWEIMAESTKATIVLNDPWGMIKSLLYIKRLRMPVPFPLSLGAYAGLLLSFFVLVVSIIKRRWELFTVSVFIFLFGVSCMTGILELPLYQGRTGWYFMLGLVWLGGIMAKRFYEQELIGDVFHTFKKVIPLAIMNRAKNINKSNVSLIYLIVTLSGLLSYLVVIWAWGLLSLSPIRDISLLLLVPSVIFIVSRKKRDVLSGEKISSYFPENARLYLSLHKVLVVAVVLVVMLYPLPKPPEYNFRYYHRSVNEDDFVKVVQEVKDEYPLSEVKMFFDRDIIRVAARKTINMMYPQNIEIVEVQGILSGIGNKRYNFLFLDYRKEKSESFKDIREWISIYEEQYGSIRVFYDSENIVVYLLENYDVSKPNQN